MGGEQLGFLLLGVMTSYLGIIFNNMLAERRAKRDYERQQREEHIAALANIVIKLQILFDEFVDFWVMVHSVSSNKLDSPIEEGMKQLKEKKDELLELSNFITWHTRWIPESINSEILDLLKDCRELTNHSLERPSEVDALRTEVKKVRKKALKVQTMLQRYAVS